MVKKDDMEVKAEYYSSKQVAKILSVSVRTVESWIANDKIRSVKIGKLRRIPVDAVEEKIERGGVND